MKQLTISKDLKLPLEIVTQTVAILAKRRVGKSYTMRGMAEQLLDNGQQVILVDPKGDQWGIRSSNDGKSPGYSVLILGGEHGDLPLEVNGGEVVAKLAVEERVSMLLDLSSFRKHEVSTFMAIFLENLYRLKAQERFRTPVMLIVDEADAIAPQKPQKGEERMLGAIEDIVRRGGQRGIGCMVVTQRSAVLNKNVLTQAQMLIVLRTIAPQDLAAMNAWIDVHGTAEERKVLMESLPALPIGDAWFWSPGWPTAEGIFKLVHVLPIKTFDSAATPKPGERKIVPKNLADVDLDALKTQMAATIEKAKAEDPKLLRKEIEKLKKDVLAAALFQREKAQIDPRVIAEAVKKAVMDKEQEMERAFWVERDEWLKQMDNWFKILIEIGKTIKLHRDEVAKTPKKLFYTKISQPEIKKIPASPAFSKEAIGKINGLADPRIKDSFAFAEKNTREANSPVFSSEDRFTLSRQGARAVLSYLHSVHPAIKTKTQIAVATGYAQGGGFDNFIYELTGKEFVMRDGKGYRTINQIIGPEVGIDESFVATLDTIKKKLRGGSKKIFDIMLETPSQSYTKAELAQGTGYALGGGFDNFVYQLTGYGLIKKSGDGFIINEEILDL